MSTLSGNPSSFSRSFTRIGTGDLRGFVDREYAKGRYWPEALLQINPNYHRGGWGNRLAQESPEVRCVLLYGHDNPVDGFILNVILRKGEDIQRELGVQVPLPQDERRIHHAVVKAAILKDHRRQREIVAAIQHARNETAFFERTAQSHADTLLQDHRRVREAAADRSTYSVRPCLPVDLIGVYVLLPESL